MRLLPDLYPRSNLVEVTLDVEWTCRRQPSPISADCTNCLKDGGCNQNRRMHIGGGPMFRHKLFVFKVQILVSSSASLKRHNEELEFAGCSDTRRQLLLDDKATTVDNSEQNNCSTLASHEPIDTDQCYAEQENPDCKPICVCFEKRLVEAVKLYESNILPLNAALKSYDFTPSTTVAANFERELYAQLVAGQDYRTLSRCLVQKYEATRHCFLRFIQLIDVINIDTLDADQLSWVRSMFSRFYRLRDLLHLAHVRSENESNPDEAAESTTEETAIDPLGCWLDSMKPKQSCVAEGLPSSCQLMNTYLSMGSSSSPLSRVFMLTGLPELCTFSGSSSQLFEFVRLWDSMESLQFELHLLKILHTALPKLLEQLVPRSELRWLDTYSACQKTVFLAELFSLRPVLRGSDRQMDNV
ncbi:hypothetical protein CLF_101299 [Clonorchis sinensis]|uniref:Uncharacterized protein n=1 Tax=Clonorchis sinensis TaxID=79923 RepID=G7Y5F9_CLOSI|nr:hypothetical protein CLF_101299 [Clonorchis sinensis]